MTKHKGLKPSTFNHGEDLPERVIQIREQEEGATAMAKEKKNTADTITLKVGASKTAFQVKKAGSVNIPELGEFQVIAFRESKDSESTKGVKFFLVIEREDKDGFSPGFWVEKDGKPALDRRYGPPNIFLENNPELALDGEEFAKVFGRAPVAEDFKKTVKSSKKPADAGSSKESKKERTPSLDDRFKEALLKLEDELEFDLSEAFQVRELLPLVNARLEKAKAEKTVKQLALLSDDQLAALGLKRL